MNKTKIEWVLNPDGSPGYSWNPITGCLNNCPYCYARKLANTRLKERYLFNDGKGLLPNSIMQAPNAMTSFAAMNDPFYPRYWEDKLYHSWGGKPKGIFVCDMSDLFGIGVPEQWTKDILWLIKRHYQNRYYLLTKQPQNLIKFSPFPGNAWVGATVTKPEFLIPALDALDSIQCSVRYLSIEPMLAAFDVPDLSLLLAGSVDWVILGSQTKPYRPPTIEAVREIVEACDKAGVKVFLKNNLKPLLENAVPFSQRYIDKLKGYTWRLRQEMVRLDVPVSYE